MKPTIIVDLDGTITESVWPELGEFMPGAVEGLKDILKFANVKVFSTRFHPLDLDEKTPRNYFERKDGIQAVRRKLDDAGLEAITLLTDVIGKPPGIAYVDDRAVRYNGRPGAWKSIVERLAVMSEQAHLLPESKYK